MAIGLISVWDLFLAVKYRHFLIEFEENPIGRLIIIVDDGDIALFVLTKFAGTVIVLGVLALIYEKLKAKTQAIILPIFMFQLFVLFYLNMN